LRSRNAAGTRQLGRIGQGGGAGGAATLNSLCVVGQRLFFVADDGILGAELRFFSLDGDTGAFAQTYGNSHCPGLGGVVPRIAAGGLPRLGNSAFTVDVSAARANSIALLALGFAPAAAPIGTCRALVAPVELRPWVFTDALGFGRTPLPVPADPAFLGLQAFVQYAVVDSAGPIFDGVSLSDALWLRVGT
jgi:hypothetical protein